jgi:hypothetical protein
MPLYSKELGSWLFPSSFSFIFIWKFTNMALFLYYKLKPQIMKKIIFLISILLSSVFVNAQTECVNGNLNLDKYDTIHVCKSEYDSVFNTYTNTYTYTNTTYTYTYNIVDSIVNLFNYPHTSVCVPFNSTTNTNFILTTTTNSSISFKLNVSAYYLNTIQAIFYLYCERPDNSIIRTTINLTIIIDTTTCATITTTINEPVNMSSIEIYPNPFTDNVNLKINALKSSKTNVTLIDMLGKVYEIKK